MPDEGDKGAQRGTTRGSREERITQGRDFQGQNLDILTPSHRPGASTFSLVSLLLHSAPLYNMSIPSPSPSKGRTVPHLSCQIASRCSFMLLYRVRLIKLTADLLSTWISKHIKQLNDPTNNARVAKQVHLDAPRSILLKQGSTTAMD